jgi:hypothetical protein
MSTREIKDLSKADGLRIRAMFVEHGHGKAAQRIVSRAFNVTESNAAILAEAYESPMSVTESAPPPTAALSAAETFRIQAAETLVKRANAAEADMHNASLQELTAWAQLAVPR